MYSISVWAYSLKQGVALRGGFLVAHGRSGVIGLQEGVGVGVGEAHLRGRHPLQPQVEQLDGLLRTRSCRSSSLATRAKASRACEALKVVLDEVVGVDPRVVEVAVAERVAQQRRGVVGVDASDLVGVLRRGEDRHQAVGVAVELEVVHQPEVLENVDLRHVDRAFPVEVGQHVEDHQLVLVERILLAC